MVSSATSILTPLKPKPNQTNSTTKTTPSSLYTHCFQRQRCVQLPGARNQYNIALIKNALILLLVGVAPTTYGLTLIHENPIPWYAMAFGLVVISVVLAQPFAMFLSFLIYCIYTKISRLNIII